MKVDGSFVTVQEEKQMWRVKLCELAHPITLESTDEKQANEYIDCHTITLPPPTGKRHSLHYE